MKRYAYDRTNAICDTLTLSLTVASVRLLSH